MSFIRTILGDIPSEGIGITYSHEHIVIEEGFVTRQHPEFLLNDVAKITEELRSLKTLGCNTVVDTMPANAGRNVLKSAEISRQTGINIVVPTGIHLEKYYPQDHWRYHYSEDQLTRLFIDDITIGIDTSDYTLDTISRSAHKSGLIKLATGDESITPHQEKIFRAVVNAHLQTGAPILTHSNYGRHALAQAEMFEKLGADLRHVVISHVDRHEDLGYHLNLMQTGVSVEYDSAFRWKSSEENRTFTYLEKLLPQFPEQIVVGMDAARSSYWKSYGGKPGLAYLLTDFTAELYKRDLGQYFEHLFVINPSRIFSFTQTYTLNKP